MKSSKIGYFFCFSGKHDQKWEKCMTALAMYKIPVASLYKKAYGGSNIEVMWLCPSLNTHDLHAFNILHLRNRLSMLMRERRQKGHINTTFSQSPSNFVNMHLSPTSIRKVTWSRHQYV